LDRFNENFLEKNVQSNKSIFSNAAHMFYPVANNQSAV